MAERVAPLVLASSSPRRADLLRAVGLEFTIRPADVDESRTHEEPPGVYVERLARAKALAVQHDGELVIGADTCVAIDDVILGKPTDAADARRMLVALSGRTHRVFTGTALACGTAIASCVTTTDVTFVELSEQDIAWYVATGEPLDKAGAYGLQGPGGYFVRRVDGSPSNVIGLPLHALNPLAAEIGLRLR